MSFENVPAVTMQSPVFGYLCPPVDGLLGTRGFAMGESVLDQVAMTIDRDRGRVLLSRGALPRLAEDVVLPLQTFSMDEIGEKIDETGSTVPVILDGEMFWAELDTGGAGISQMTLDTFLGLGRSLDDEGVRTFIGPHAVTAGGVSSRSRSWIAEIHDVRLGRFTLRNVPFRIIEQTESEMPYVRLNQDVIKRFNMTLDYRRNEIRLRKRLSLESETSLPTQLMWDVRDGRVVAVGILENGAAQNAGIAIGDELLMFDNREVRGDNPESLCPVRAGLEGYRASIRVRLRRGNEEFEIELPVVETGFGIDPNA
jgi:hypothetical protein